MSNPQHSERHTLPELKIKLAGMDSETVDTAYGMEIKVRVDFDYDPPEEDDPANVRNLQVYCAGDADLEGERTTITLRDGCDITPYITSDDSDKIQEAMIDLMLGRAKEERVRQLEDDAEAVAEEKKAPRWPMGRPLWY